MGKLSAYALTRTKDRERRVLNAVARLNGEFSLQQVWEATEFEETAPLRHRDTLGRVPYGHVQRYLYALAQEGALTRLPKRDGDRNQAWYRHVDEDPESEEGIE